MPSPPSQSSHSSAESPEEQKLQDWIRGKRCKDDFEVLKEDKHPGKWEIPFEAEIVQQGLQVMIDPNFDPKKDDKAGFGQELYDLQIIYFWTVVLHVLKNSFGGTCVSEF